MKSELIYKQAAVELAMSYCHDDDGTCSKSGDDIRNLLDDLENLQPAPEETSRMLVGKSIDWVILWYVCEKCGKPVHKDDNYCSFCGRRLQYCQEGDEDSDNDRTD